MKTQSAFILLIGLSLLSQLSYAGKRHTGYSDSFIDEARVITAKPIYQYKTYETKECYRNQSSHNISDYDDYDSEYDSRVYYNDKDYSGVVIGGILGGLTGTRFGKGNGRKAATVAGSVLGAVIGDKIVNDNKPVHTIKYAHHRSENNYNCEKHRHRRDKIISGYKVKYRYNGHIFSTITEHHPGKTIDVRVKLKPVS